MPFGLQPIHLIIIAIVALILFGPARLPEIGRGLGRALNEFRKGTKEMTESFREEFQKPQGEGSIPISPSRSIEQPLAGDRVVCPHCEAANPAGAQYCNHCGSQLVSSI